MSAEAIRTPVAGAIFWAEAALEFAAPSSGATGPTPSPSPTPSPAPTPTLTLRGIAGPPPALKVSLTINDPPNPPPPPQKPPPFQGIKAIVTPRGCAFVAPPVLIPAPPNPPPPSLDAALADVENSGLPTLRPISVTGQVDSLDGRYFPRLFTVTPNPAQPSYVALRPSRQATRVTEAGAVILTLAWDTGAPASWSLVVLVCVRDGLNLAFSGQADANGDVIVPLTGLPPLADQQPPDQMTMTVSADIRQSGAAAGDPDKLTAASFAIAGSPPAASQTFTVPRGAVIGSAILSGQPAQVQTNPLIVLSH